MGMVMVNGIIRSIDGAATKAGEAAYVETSSPGGAVAETAADVLAGVVDYRQLGRGVSIRWFLPADRAGGHRLSGGKTFAAVPALRGTFECTGGSRDRDRPRAIWLRRDLKMRDLIWVLGHEADHAAQELSGECRGTATPEQERKANAFGDWLLNFMTGRSRAA
jgi:hypothetical protein